jgi:hypothetical protein
VKKCLEEDPTAETSSQCKQTFDNVLYNGFAFSRRPSDFAGHYLNNDSEYLQQIVVLGIVTLIYPYH